MNYTDSDFAPCELAPTAFSSNVLALAKLTCTCDAVALAIAGPIATEHVMFGHKRNNQRPLVEKANDMTKIQNYIR